MIAAMLLLCVASPDSDEVLAKVQATYRNAGDITADFSQSYIDGLRGKKRTETGKLTGVRPPCRCLRE